jgi:hypothetical protein
MNAPTSELNVPWWAFVLPAVMSLLALADLPYGYYQLLRIVVTGAAAWIAYSCYGRSNLVGVAAFAAIAIIFNPIAKIHMERELHAIFNVLTAIILIFGLWLQSRRRPDS